MSETTAVTMTQGGLPAGAGGDHPDQVANQPRRPLEGINAAAIGRGQIEAALDLDSITVAAKKIRTRDIAAALDHLTTTARRLLHKLSRIADRELQLGAGRRDGCLSAGGLAMRTSCWNGRYPTRRAGSGSATAPGPGRSCSIPSRQCSRRIP